MKEDNCQIYRGNAAEILSAARKLALDMLRAETTRKVSVLRKQKRAHGSTDYLEKVLGFGSVERYLIVHALTLIIKVSKLIFEKSFEDATLNKDYAYESFDRFDLFR